MFDFSDYFVYSRRYDPNKDFYTQLRDFVTHEYEISDEQADTLIFDSFLKEIMEKNKELLDRLANR